MQTRNRVLDDLAKVAGGAVSTMAGIKGELDTLVRQQLERLMAQMDAVPRDEFEAIKAVAVKARAEQENLEKRLTRLEARLAKGGGKAAARKPATKKKPAAKPATKAAAASKAKATTRTAAGRKPAAKAAPRKKAAGPRKPRKGKVKHS